MLDRDAVIDLGEVGPEQAALTALPRPPLPYRWVLGLLAVVLSVTIGGAAPWAESSPAAVIVPVSRNDGVLVSGDRFFLLGTGQPAVGDLQTYSIRSFRLPSAQPLASYAVTVAGEVSNLIEGPDGMLLVAYHNLLSGRSGTAAVRAGSAEPVWVNNAYLYDLSPDRRTVFVLVDVQDGAVTRQDWVGLDVRTGEVRWRVAPPAGGLLTVSDTDVISSVRPGRIYTMAVGGHLTAWDTLTGRPVASAAQALPVKGASVLRAFGDLVLVENGDAGTVGYHGDDLSVRWRRVTRILPNEESTARECGPVICVDNWQSGMTAVDVATGRDLWTGRSWDFSEPIGDHLLVGSYDQATPDLSVLDARTGVVVAHLGDWGSGGPGPSPGTAWVHQIRPADNDLRYGVLDLDTGKIHLLGAAERIAGDCQFRAGAVICRRLDSALFVRRL